MTLMKHVALASVVIVGLSFAASADAGDAKMIDCIHMAKQVSTAIDTAKPGDAAEQARSMARDARKFCSSNMYGRGVSLYTKALALLGNTDKS
jgi:hypothetical protein